MCAPFCLSPPPNLFPTALFGAGAYFGGPGIMSALGKAGASPFIMGAKGALAKGAAMPLISKPLTSAATSYGLARLMRARNPEKAALYGALSTLPFFLIWPVQTKKH